jgi:rubrerythrin
MKKIFIAIILCSLSLGVFAQKATTTKKTTSTKTAIVASYRCPVCGFTATKTGDCPKDKTGLVQVGDYYCPECYMTSKKAGKCPMCAVDMKKMEPQTATGTVK